MIEHHLPEKSKHKHPHVQMRIHGPAPDDRVGKFWITLPLHNEKEYYQCIDGFFCVLDDVMERCAEGLSSQLLNLAEIRKLLPNKAVLIGMISKSMNNNTIEFQDPDGRRIYLNKNRLARILKEDQTLLPFFPPNK